VAFLNEKRESDDVDQTVPAISPSELRRTQFHWEERSALARID
jgi:hypothetical protein